MSETDQSLAKTLTEKFGDAVVQAEHTSDMPTFQVAPERVREVLRFLKTDSYPKFLRLDDLPSGYALGQMDRAIIMSANQVNARIIIPVTTYEQVIKGEAIDFVLYANNYSAIDEDHPVLERFADEARALEVFRDGTVMSKGTTTSTGLVHSYFANVFGPVQYKAEHEVLARRYFEGFFKSGIFVGEIRTRLGLSGWEQKGPEEAAKELLRLIEGKAK